MRRARIYVLAVSTFLAGACSTKADPKQEALVSASPSPTAAGPAASAPTSQFDCESGKPASGDSVSVRGSSHELRSAPSANASRLVNRKATEIFGETQYQVIDDSTRVQLQCLSGHWARVQIVDPEWLAGVRGWVKRSVLVIASKTGEERQFLEEDIAWDKDTRKHKAAILQGLNKIRREDKRCVKDMAASSVSVAPFRSKPGKPVFFVQCGQGMETVNVFFSPADVASGKTFSAPVHIDHLSATNLCEDYAKAHSGQSSTIDFSRLMSLAVLDHANGRTTVQSTFTAKNAFGVEQRFNIRCLLDSSGLIEGAITDG